MSELKAGIPILPVKSIDDATKFYTTKLGFENLYSNDEYAIFGKDRVDIHVWAATDTSWKERENNKPVVSGAESFIAGTASCRIFASDVEALYDKYSKSQIIHPNGKLNDTEYGTKEFAVLDQDGNLITFYENLKGMN